MSSIRSQREERSEANRVPVFALVRKAVDAVRNLWRGRKPMKRRSFTPPKPERRSR